MGFYGGKTGQHFYIAGVYQSEDVMKQDSSIISNQFVLLIEGINSHSLWIKSGEEFLKIGEVGAITPTINNRGEWSIGDMSMGELARPYKIFLKVPYDSETEKYIPDEDDKCYIQYAYAPDGTEINSISEWNNLVEITGLHTLNTYVEEFNTSKEDIDKKAAAAEEKANLIKILTELTKSYTDGSGDFNLDIVIPEEYQTVLEKRAENQNIDNAEYYYSGVLAAETVATDKLKLIKEECNKITEILDWVKDAEIDETDTKLTAWRAMVTAELGAAARADMKSDNHPLINERLDKFLYQFDTYADMRICSLLQPGDTCVVFGASRLGDNNSLLFRVYANDEEMKASGDLTESEGKYYISLPGGVKKPSEKQLLKNGYIAYSIAMFSGLGGGTGSGGTSSGSITTTFSTTAVQPGTTLDIPIEWYGQVSGDGTLYVYERATTASGGSIYLTQTEFPEGHQTFKWTATNEGARTLVVYVQDRMGNKTNQLKIDIVVGGLKASIIGNNNVKYDMGETAKVNISLQSIIAGEVEINYSLNGTPKNPIIVEVKASSTVNKRLEFSNLAAGGYTVDIIVSQSGLPDVKLSCNFSINAIGQVSLIEYFDETAIYPLGKLIPIEYEAYYKGESTFNNSFYLGGGDLEIPEAETNKVFNGVTYQLIGTASSGLNEIATFQLNPDAYNLTTSQSYNFMIISVAANYPSITGQLNTPIVLNIGEAEEGLVKSDQWNASSLLYYFDARQGQQNSDANRAYWEDIAPKFTGNTQPPLMFALNENSFNWATNGWNPAGHEGLYFDNTAKADLVGEGISQVIFSTKKQIFGTADKEGQGLTFDFYLTTYDYGIDARLFELPFIRNDGEIGIAINTKSVKVSTGLSDYFGLNVAIEPGKKNHITIVFEPIGVTNYQDQEGNVYKSGLIRIYLNGICCAASTVTTDFLTAEAGFNIPNTILFNNSLADVADQVTENKGQKYEQGVFELYSFKVFNAALNHQEVLYNYIYDLKNTDEQEAELAFNKLNDAGKITNPVVRFYPADGTLDGITKDDEKVMRVTYQPSADTVLEYNDCEVKWQGTSSIAYPVKNYKVKFPEKFALDNKNSHITADKTDDGTIISHFGKREKTYTLKADYMDSSHCHNTCNANFFNDTGLLTEYSLTPAQVLDIYQLNEEILNKNADYYDIVENIKQGNYYYKINDNKYRPYKLSDFPKDIALQIRNSIYGIPCELYAYVKTGEKKEDGTEIWDDVFLGIYNFNNDKGNLNTFGLYRDVDDTAYFPGCTSFEIAANSNSTSGAFKSRQFVKHLKYDANGEIELDNDGNEIVLGYYATNLSTEYMRKENSINEYDIVLFGQSNNYFCECCRYELNTDTWKLSLVNVKDAEFIVKKQLVETTIEEAWKELAGDNFSKIEAAYNDLLLDYYVTDFELRAPDNDNYYADKDKDIPTQEYYDEYNKLKSLIAWANNADAATFKAEFADHFDLDTTLNYYLFVMVSGLIDNFGKNLMINTWGCDKTGQIPYITKTGSDNATYYKVRQFSRKNDGADTGSYIYGYSTCVKNWDNQIVIYNATADDNIGTEVVAILEGDYKAWNGSSYTDITNEEGLSIKYGCWQKLADESRYIWYPHPYDLDSCLGVDNMGRLRYGADIEMLPKTANEGFNDYYDHVYWNQQSPFNTATSNLWKKFYTNFSSEIEERYKLLRSTGIFTLDTFKQFYYTNEIKYINRKAYNLDMESKYLSGEIANVVVNGAGKQVYPTSYIWMCRGDDWDRIYDWIKKRLNFLDSLYKYSLMADVITARASGGNYKLTIGLYNPQYLAVAWSNKQDNTTNDIQHQIWPAGTAEQYYGLVHNVFSLSNMSNIEYGFVQIKKTANGDYDYNTNLFIFDTDLEEYVSVKEGGNYYAVYGVNKNNSTDMSKWEPILNSVKYGYLTHWDIGVVNNNYGNFQMQKIGEKFEAATTNYTRIRLAPSSGVYEYSSSTADQEVNIYGASNIKTIDGLTTLKPKSLDIGAALGLLELECHGGTYSSLQIDNLTKLRKIDLSNTLSLSDELDISNMSNLTYLNTGLTNITGITFPSKGGNLSTLILNQNINQLQLINQQQLNEVTLQAILDDNYSTNVDKAIENHSAINLINIQNCPNLKFKFQAIKKEKSSESYSIVNLPYVDENTGEETRLGKYVREYGLFSMFKSLRKLNISNSCYYNEETNPYGICKDGQFILSIPYKSQNNITVPDLSSGVTLGKNINELTSVTIQNMPVKTFTINASSGSVIFPGARLDSEYNAETLATKLTLGASLENIEVIGNKLSTVYMPSVNDWSSYINLKKINFSGVNIKNREPRYRTLDTERAINVNALAIILPDTSTLKEINFNDDINNDGTYANCINEITSIGIDKDRINVIGTDTLAIENAGENIIDLTGSYLSLLKTNFTGFQKIDTIKGLDRIRLKVANSTDPSVTTFGAYFANCTNLKNLYNAKGEAFNFVSNGITWNKFKINPSLSKMFLNCKSLTNSAISAFIDENEIYGPEEDDYDRGEFDYYELTAADEMFNGCIGLNKLIVRFNNVGKLKTLSKFAYNCKNVTIGNITIYDSEALTDLSYLFAQSSEDNQGALTNFDLSIYYKDSIVKNSGLQTVTTLEGLLSNCINLTALDMSTWNVSGLKTIKAMCYNNKNLKTIILANSYTFNLLEIADQAFAQCKSLESFNSKWYFNTLVSLYYLFYECNNLDISFIADWDMNNVIKITGLLYSAGNNKTALDLDISNWKVVKITDASSAFRNTKLLSVTSTRDFTVENDYCFNSLTNASYMFEGSKITAFTSTLIPSMAKLTNIRNMFNNCQFITTSGLGNGYKKWDVSLVEDFQYMFYNNAELTSLDISRWSFSKALQYNYMFSNCVKLETITGLKNLFPSDVIKSRIINHIFAGCAALKEVSLSEVSEWAMFDENDECLITSFYATFKGCKQLTNSNKIFTNTLLGKKYSKVTNIQEIFSDCINCTNITLPAMTNITNAIKAFYNCPALALLDLHLANFYHCNDGNLVANIATSDALYQWLSGPANGTIPFKSTLKQIIFPKANATNKIGFFNCTIDLTSIPLTNYDAENSASFGQYLNGELEATYQIALPTGGTSAISQALLLSDPYMSGNDYIPNIKIYNNETIYNNYFEVARTYYWNDEVQGNYETESDYISGKKNWMIGV